MNKRKTLNERSILIFFLKEKNFKDLMITGTHSLNSNNK